MSKNTVAVLPIDQLRPHPKNPRLAIRRDVVDSIKAGIDADGFAPRHALTVRPQDGGYQIISGHQRHIAATEAGLSELPCWVLELDDEAAYMALATDNAQGELSPLEVGMHALECVGKGSPGRGKKGGLSEYARAIGKSKQYLGQLIAAAAVAKSTSQLDDLLGHAQHLAEIHTLPSELWPGAVEHMLRKGWSVKDTAEAVKRAADGATHKRKLALFLEQTRLGELSRIDELRASVARFLTDDDLRAEWLGWLDDTDPVDVKEVQHKRIELEDKQAKREEAEAGQAASELPSVVLADPPWRYDFAATDNRQIENQYPSATPDEIIAMRPQTAPDCVLFLWATVAKLLEALEVMDAWGFEYKTHAVWDKEKIGMGYWFRGQHELLLVGTKGKAAPPPEQHRVSSVFREPRGTHSAKPDCVYDWISRAFPDARIGEMFQRTARPRFVSMKGNEAPHG